VWRDPEHKVSSTGKAYATATVRVGSGHDATWWKLLAFCETTKQELHSLRDGDAVSATGEFKAEIYNKGTGPKIALTLFADRVISARRAKRERASERRLSVTIVELGPTVHGITLHKQKQGDRCWIGLPGKPPVTDGELQTYDRNKTIYAAVLEIGDRRIRNAFGVAVWQAALRACPEIATRGSAQ
jgi:hypothetical protein